MATDTDLALLPQDYEKAAHKLRDMVTTIEFTMISIIAGLMLFPWIDYAAPLIHDLRFEYWVYLAIVLVSIMFYWVALLDHALSFVGWPIDIGHNLIYLILFPTLGVVIHFVSDPEAFYPMFFVANLCAILLSMYDLLLIRSRLPDASGAEGELFRAAYARQRTLVRLVVPGVGIAGLCAVLVAVFPGFFLEQHMHVIPGSLILLVITFLLVREFRELNRMRTKMLRRAAEEMAVERMREWRPTEPVIA